MKKIIHVVVAVLIGSGLATPAAADPVRPGAAGVEEWNELALNAVRLRRATDADAARMYAMLNVAQYDAVNGILSRSARPARTPALVPGPGPREGDLRAAAVSAAHAVMVALDPDRTGLYDDTLAADLAGIRPGHRRDAGVAWGRSVGRLVVAARADDGLIESIEDPARRFCVGVLWHPDAEPAGHGAPLFRALVSSSS